ncbi:hypothetical protein BGP77_17115 [Saccharospirillum sp. MSK14-1]|nr:hypothetical protein BGP77_17115 [Saccharospirillum sp. MSK14-1]
MKKPAPLLGVDISSSAIRLIELTASARSQRVEAYACESLPEGVVVDQTIKDANRLSQMIARLIQRSRSRIRQAATLVSGTSVITKVITVDDLASDVELEHLIQLEAGAHIPYPLEDVALDFDVLGPSSEPDRWRVLLVASRREEVEALDDVLQMAGLDAQVVDVEALVLERALALIAHQYDAQADDAVALVDLEPQRLTLNVLQQGHIVYRREQALPSPPLTGLSASTAAEPVSGSLGMAQDMIETIQQNLQFFYASTSASPISGVLLGGSSDGLPVLADALSEAIGLPAELVDPVAHLECAPRVNRQQLANDSSALMRVCGLALRSFDHGHR